MLKTTDSESTTARQTGAQTVSFAEMCKQIGFNHVEVVVDSHGYTTAGLFGHYEPFKNQRQFIFTLDWSDDGFWLTHHTPEGCASWLTFEDENNEFFWKDEQGQWRCQDPELISPHYY